MTRPTTERAGLLARLRGATLDLTPLRVSRPYRRLLAGDAVSVIGTQVTTVAVPIQVYDLTGSAAAVGLVGLAGLLPLVVFGLYGGAIADAVDRRSLVLLTTAGQALLATVLLLQAVLGLERVGLLYAVVAVQAALFAVDSPARQAFVPRLLPVHLLPAANALKQVEFNLGVTVGPLLAGSWWHGPATARRTAWTRCRSPRRSSRCAGCPRCRPRGVAGAPARPACSRAWRSCARARCCS